MATENYLRHKKKTLQETSAYCVSVLFRKKRGTYLGSTIVPTFYTLQMI